MMTGAYGRRKLQHKLFGAHIEREQMKTRLCGNNYQYIYWGPGPPENPKKQYWQIWYTPPPPTQ